MLFSDANATEATTVPSGTGASTIVPANLPTGDAAGEPSPILTAAPLVLIFVVFYFLLIRPQQKKLREHEAVVKGLHRGDKIVTAGGIIGVIHKVDEDVLVIEIAPDVRIRVVRDTISHVVASTVANDNKSN